MTMEEQQFVETANAESLEALLLHSLNEATGQRDKHTSNQRRIVRIGKATQTFANNFSSFLQAYSGIIEIMKGADEQYGGAAYSALSLLLIVGGFHKRKNCSLTSVGCREQAEERGSH